MCVRLKKEWKHNLNEIDRLNTRYKTANLTTRQLDAITNKVERLENKNNTIYNKIIRNKCRY